MASRAHALAQSRARGHRLQQSQNYCEIAFTAQVLREPAPVEFIFEPIEIFQMFLQIALKHVNIFNAFRGRQFMADQRKKQKIGGFYNTILWTYKKYALF